MHGELGDVLSGQTPGRTSEEEITITKFVGIGVPDLAADVVALEKLRSQK